MQPHLGCQCRLQRNRESAQQARERKKAHVVSLERRVASQDQRIQRLQKYLRKATDANAELRHIIQASRQMRRLLQSPSQAAALGKQAFPIERVVQILAPEHPNAPAGCAQLGMQPCAPGSVNMPQPSYTGATALQPMQPEQSSHQQCTAEPQELSTQDAGKGNTVKVSIYTFSAPQSSSVAWPSNISPMDSSYCVPAPSMPSVTHGGQMQEQLQHVHTRQLPDACSSLAPAQCEFHQVTRRCTAPAVCLHHGQGEQWPLHSIDQSSLAFAQQPSQQQQWCTTQRGAMQQPSSGQMHLCEQQSWCARVQLHERQLQPQQAQRWRAEPLLLASLAELIA